MEQWQEKKVTHIEHIVASRTCFFRGRSLALNDFFFIRKKNNNLIMLDSIESRTSIRVIFSNENLLNQSNHLSSLLKK